MSYQQPRGFLRGIEPRHFLDRHEEWHALVQGLCEVLCPWPPRHKEILCELKREIVSEHHYYMAGRALGALAWITIAAAIISFLR
ncbi:MAG: hypothetical protein ACLFVD_02670 [Dehalococcoidia bacterium]